MFKKTAKQFEAINLFGDYIEVLLEGGSRSGKTFIEIYAIIARAIKYPGTRHLCLRRHFNHAKLTLWMQTIPEVFKICFPDIGYKDNKTDYYFEVGGSQIWIGGTDDKERIEKILGSEWATIFLNEISQMPYSTYETLKTRLNAPIGVKPLLMLDQNPPSRSHWSFIKFHENKNPENKVLLSQEILKNQTYLKMNPEDNRVNLSAPYIGILESLSESRKRRFLYGEYGDDSENALWKRDWIIKNRVDKTPDIAKMVVAVDPAVTGNETSNNTGIIPAGRAKVAGEDHYYVFDDRTYHGDVIGWGQEVVAVYKKYKADKVIGEVNQGGDLVEMNIRNYDRNIPFDSVHATRGKAMRAEPVADLYRRGYVHHVGEFPDLEDQMCTWTPESLESPDNMDALVWGISYLAGLDTRTGGVGKVVGW